MPTAATVKPGDLLHHWRTSSNTAAFGRPWAAPRYTVSPASTWRRKASSSVERLSGPSWRGSSSRRLMISWELGSICLLQALGHELGDILDLQRLLRPRHLAAEVDHGKAEGAGDADDVGLGAERLLDADHVHTLLGRRLHPHLPAPAAAAETALAIAGELDEAESGHGACRLARGLEDPVVA